MSLVRKKKSILDELINIPTKAEERSMIQISFWTQDSNIKTGTIRNRLQNSQLIYDPLCFQNPRIHSIYHKNPQSVRFFKAKSVDPKTYSPPSNRDNLLANMIYMFNTELAMHYRAIFSAVL